MIVYHITPSHNLDSIRAKGLIAHKGIWFCTGSKIRWTLEHMVNHHGYPISHLCVLKFRISRYYLIRKRMGIYWAKEVPPYQELHS